MMDGPFTRIDRELPTVESGEELVSQWELESAAFDRRQARHRRIALWFMPFYGLGGLLAGCGIAIVGWQPHMRGTMAVLIIGVTLIVFGQWAQPYWTRRSDRKE